MNMNMVWNTKRKYLFVCFLLSISKLSLATNNKPLIDNDSYNPALNNSALGEEKRDITLIPSCENVFMKIESMNKNFAKYTQEPLMKKNLEQRLASVQNLIALLPDEDKKETCDNILVQIDSLLPGVIELEKAAQQQ